MKNFNPGDVVVRIEGSWCQSKKGDEDVVCHLDEEGLRLVGHSGVKFDPECYDLVDEKLPEPPDSSRFECAMFPGRDYVVLDAKGSAPDIGLIASQRGSVSVIVLSVETALVMASDLMRMALKKKRESEE